MRFYQEDYAYEVEKVRDPATQLYSGWRYKVYRVRPVEELLRSGNAPTREDAERTGRKACSLARIGPIPFFDQVGPRRGQSEIKIGHPSRSRDQIGPRQS